MDGKRLSKAQRRELLVEAALRVLRRGGPQALTTRAVTGEAGMPHGAFQWCFGSKEDLIAALAERDAHLPALSAGDEAAASDLGQALHLYLERYWQGVEQDRAGQLGLTELELLSLRSHGPRAEQADAYRQQVEALLEQLGTTHDVSWPKGVPTMSSFVVSALRGITLQWLLDHNSTRARQDLRVLAGVLTAEAHNR